MIDGYTAWTEYHFKVGGEVMAVTDQGAGWLMVEEVRKNGQEDCHMLGTLKMDDEGNWFWDESWSDV